MTFHIDDRAALLARTHAGAALKKAGIADLREFAPHTFAWGDLVAAKRELLAACRSVTAKLDAAPEKGEDLEQAFDALLAAADAAQAEMDHRDGLGNRAPRAHADMPDPRRPRGEAVVARGVDDGSPAPARPLEAVGFGPEQRMRDHVREWATPKAASTDYGVGLGAYLRAMITSPSNDAERRALSENTNSAGGYTVPDVLSSELIDLARANMVCVQAGARTVPLTSDQNFIAKVVTDPTPAWRAEAAAIAESDPVFGRVTLAPKSLAVFTKVSMELMQDSLNLGVRLPQILAAAMAVELDRACLVGSGSGSEPTGISETADINTIAHDAGITSYAPLVRARTALRTDNINGRISYVMHPRVGGDFAELVDSQGQPLNMPRVLEEASFYETTSIPADIGTALDSLIVAGDFSQLIIGVRTEITIGILRERFMVDSGQLGVVAVMRADVAVERPSAFCTITGIAA